MSTLDSSILVIDDACQNALGRLSGLVMQLKKTPGIRVDNYSPLMHGRPRQDFNWGQYDILIIDGLLGNHFDFQCLKDFKDKAQLPYTAVISNPNDQIEGELARELGISEFILDNGSINKHITSLVGRRLLLKSRELFSS